MIVLNSSDTDKAKQFAKELSKKKFELYQSRHSYLTEEKLYDDIYRGKCGELAAYYYLKNNGYAVSGVDFKIYNNIGHDADLEIIGSGIQIHVKTCRKSFLSWLFERNAPYVCRPTKYDHNCLVQQLDFYCYRIVSIRNSGDYAYEPTIKPMPSKLAIYL